MQQPKGNISSVTDGNKDELEYKIEIATQTLERNVGFVTHCDNKTSIVLAAVGVLLTIVLTNDGLSAIFGIVNSCIKEKTFCNIFYIICFGVTIFVLSLGFFYLFSVIIAKTSEEAFGLGTINSSIFFSGIRKNEGHNAYHDKFCAMSRQELLDELIAQIYINADIATQKYAKYNTGFRLTIIGFISFVIILLIGIYLY